MTSFVLSSSPLWIAYVMRCTRARSERTAQLMFLCAHGYDEKDGVPNLCNTIHLKTIPNSMYIEASSFGPSLRPILAHG